MDVGVLVVGAGPVGLTTALLLAQAGLSVAVVDRGPGPVTESRATDIHARTMELLAPSGVTDLLLAHGRKVDRVEGWSGGRSLGACRMSALRSPYPFILTVPQCTVEGALVDRLAEAGVTVHRSATVTGVDQDADGVRADCGSAGVAKARWLVAADGAASSVRGMEGIDFAGRTYPGDWVLADLEVDRASLDRTSMHMLFSPRGLAVVLPMHLPDWLRVFVHLPDDAGADSLDGLRTELGRRGWSGDVADVRWMSRFRTQRRLATSYGHGRVLLAGDAAHLCSPIGGQGLNLGLRDAVALAAVLPSAGDAGALDGWRAGRRTAARRVLAATDIATRVSSGPSSFALRRAALAAAFGLPPARRLLARTVSGRFFA
jgi:2-polyprenyl-6-methoxyphenol hydroxylase-like FAD-dependent oxidoreductase